MTSDGRYIVFVSDRNGRNQLWRIDIDGRNPRQLTDVEGISARFSVSPTDSSVFYPIVANKISTIWKVSIDGGTPEQITAAVLEYYRLGIHSFLLRGFENPHDTVAIGRELIPRIKAGAEQIDRQAEAAE